MTYVIPRSNIEAFEDSEYSSKYDLNEMLFKILVIGDYGVGKTAIIRRYTKGIFSQNYKITIGVDFAIKTLKWDEKTLVTLQLWDIAGHERFGYMTRVYYKYATAAIIVFDLTRLATMNSVIKWLKDVKEKVTLQNGQSIPVLLLANKCDITGVTIPCKLLSQFCEQHNFLAWFFTSAKENVNINDSLNIAMGGGKSQADWKMIQNSNSPNIFIKSITMVQKCDAIEYLVDKIIDLNKQKNESPIIPNTTVQLSSKKIIRKEKCC